MVVDTIMRLGKYQIWSCSSLYGYEMSQRRKWLWQQSYKAAHFGSPSQGKTNVEVVFHHLWRVFQKLFTRNHGILWTVNNLQVILLDLHNRLRLMLYIMGQVVFPATTLHWRGRELTWRREAMGAAPFPQPLLFSYNSFPSLLSLHPGFK